ncbi:hypothetical protein FOZ62_000498 [Perkinsus olseni]|nr:hypothetical protein FOZ62_000498 [Perkinsus olseni]
MDFSVGNTAILERHAVAAAEEKGKSPRAREKSLGSNGRDVLRREITKRLRAFPHLRIVANRIAPIRFATVPQLHQIAEDVGIGEIAAVISRADQAHRKSKKGGKTDGGGRRKSTGGRADVNVKEAIAGSLAEYRWSLNDGYSTIHKDMADSGQGEVADSHSTDPLNLDLHLSTASSSSSHAAAPFHNITSLAVSIADGASAVSSTPVMCWDNPGVAAPNEVSRLGGPLSLPDKAHDHQQPFTTHDRDYNYRDYSVMRQIPSLSTSLLWDINNRDEQRESGRNPVFPM